MRDAIVYSGSAWETFNVPERVALALNLLGARVLYCEHPASILRQSPTGLREVEKGIFAFRPAFGAERLNRVPLLQSLQMAFVGKQISEKAKSLQLRRPMFFYPWLNARPVLLSQMRGKFPLIHMQMDYGEPNALAHVAPSDITLAIPHSVYHQQRARFGEKVKLIPQVADLRVFETADGLPVQPSAALDAIPRPRLGYLGPAYGQINKALVSELLQSHPDWHFVSVGPMKSVPLPNAHALPWQSRQESAKYAAGFDVGFMPYNCYDEEKLHCLPLKLFEYFALGLPVVATPILELGRYEDLVYFGDTAEELARAVELALQEPRDSPKKRRRMEIAKGHTIEALAEILAGTVPIHDD
jgi:Glycosyl transferases group 1